MRYSTSLPSTQHKRGVKYHLLYDTPLSTTKDGSLTCDFLAHLLSCGNLPSFRYMIRGFLQSLVSVVTGITGISSIAFLHIIYTNNFLVRWGKVEDASLIGASGRLFFDLSTCCDMKLMDCFVNDFTLSAYNVRFFPRILYNPFVWLATAIESMNACMCSHPILMASCNPAMSA